MFLVEVGTEIVIFKFQICRNHNCYFRCAKVGIGFVFFFNHVDSDFWLIVGRVVIFILNDSKISKQKYGEYLVRLPFGL